MVVLWKEFFLNLLQTRHMYCLDRHFNLSKIGTDPSFYVIQNLVERKILPSLQLSNVEKNEILNEKDEQIIFTWLDQVFPHHTKDIQVSYIDISNKDIERKHPAIGLWASLNSKLMFLKDC